MPRPSRRTVLATGSTLAGAALAGGLPAQATAATPVATPATAASAPSEDAWRTVLDDADLVWQKMPKTWYEGPYLGNGLPRLRDLRRSPGKNAIRFNVQHSEVQDHRPEFGSLFGLARLPIGYFTLEPVGAITGLDWRLRLRDAELTGTLTTDKGTLTIRAQVNNALSRPRRRGHPVRGRARLPLGLPPRAVHQPARRVQADPGRLRRAIRPPSPASTAASPPPSSRCCPAASTSPPGASAPAASGGRCT